MKKSHFGISLAAVMAALVITPTVHGAGQQAVDYIFNSYLVMLVQSEGMRFWCF